MYVPMSGIFADVQVCVLSKNCNWRLTFWFRPPSPTVFFNQLSPKPIHHFFPINPHILLEHDEHTISTRVPTDLKVREDTGNFLENKWHVSSAMYED